jgi:hypothetical protein
MVFYLIYFGLGIHRFQGLASHGAAISIIGALFLAKKVLKDHCGYLT